MTQLPETPTGERGVPEGIELPIPAPRQGWARPWVQVVLIVGLLAAAVWVALDGRPVWGMFLGLGGAAFGASFILRRMVGDEYGRS